ncbi:pentapeptide repeat-containing protein [Myxococcus sp. RHSTA-1-4]|uniref:pentapeptide repeat-containing protein n=1 Tax=Myxococcus sp. RHSTA-1-4 TaxID=2874601 RepID=UPI001CBB5E4B|nr:pentapeptide repeat-containing protein [Myxococcus sp. RHSTA-1-4]MBZ4421537.1 pentapeptide repeat-containing protein [Myxococcus sp. RHSTA-1-4]
MIQFSDREMENERLELDSKTELYYLGHHLTLRRCNLIIKVPTRALVITRTQLIDCTVDIKRELKNFRWEGVILHGCRFTGAMTGNDFGRWPYAEHPELGSIKDCDFTGARLDACRFLSCDPGTLKFPPWPCFTILDPVRRKDELLSLQWPGEMRINVESFTDAPPETAAVTYFAPAMAKRNGTTEDAIRAVLDTLDGVIL